MGTKVTPPRNGVPIGSVQSGSANLPIAVHPEYLRFFDALWKRGGGVTSYSNDELQPTIEKGKANGYASLGATALVPVAQLGAGTADATTFLRGDGTWQPVWAGGATGTATVDFGAAPGTNIAQTVVTGQAGITATSSVDAFLMAEATADHNAYEHIIVPLQVIASDVVAGSGFTVNAVSELRLTGKFTVRWSWV